MSRPRLVLGTPGKITRTKVAENKWRARARYRDFSGRTKQVEAFTPAGEKDKLGSQAEKALVAKLDAKRASAGELISGETTVKTLGKVWFADLEQSGRCTEQTTEKYAHILEKHIVPALGEVKLVEARVGILDAVLRKMATKTPATAKVARVILSDMFTYAVRFDALTSNPVREIRLPRQKKKPIVAMSVHEGRQLLEAIKAWENADDVRGPRRGTDLSDLMKLMFATGTRISEALGLRWDDIDLAAEKPTVTISGTLVYTKSQGLFRQDHPKTVDGYRIITLPTEAVAVLMRRSLDAIPTESNAVFPAGSGHFKWPNNVRRTLRSAMEGMEAEKRIHPHIVRKAVMTLLKDKMGGEAAAAVAGWHDAKVGEEFYFQKPNEAPDSSSHTSAFLQNADDFGG